MRQTKPTYPPKPKIAATRASVKQTAAGWDFFPPATRAKVVQRVTTAIDAYYVNVRPDSEETRRLEQAGLPVLPRKRRRGRPPSAEVDQLVSQLAHIYASRHDKLPARSWDLAEPTEFESFVADALRVVGVNDPEAAATAAVTRHNKDRQRLPDDPDEDGMIFSKPLKDNNKK